MLLSFFCTEKCVHIQVPGNHAYATDVTDWKFSRVSLQAVVGWIWDLASHRFTGRAVRHGRHGQQHGRGGGQSGRSLHADTELCRLGHQPESCHYRPRGGDDQSLVHVLEERIFMPQHPGEGPRRRSSFPWTHTACGSARHGYHTHHGSAITLTLFGHRQSEHEQQCFTINVILHYVSQNGCLFTICA